MKRQNNRLLVVLLLAFLFTPALAAAEGGEASGAIELGASGLSVSDNDKRVNEYSTVGNDNGLDLYGRATVEAHEGPVSVELDSTIFSEDDVDADLKLDVSRIFRLESEYQKFNHFLPHDQLNYMDATMQDVNTKANPSVYAEDLVADEDFMIIHREWESEAKLTVPSMPNVTLKTGLRIEEREGTEQAIGISHCSACHIQGESRNVDETTTDVTIGATGKFGMLTVDYEFLTREFEENADPRFRSYLVSGKPVFNGVDGSSPFPEFRNRLLYDGFADEAYVYNTTPDSEKDVHSLKARYDMKRDTVLTATWINAEIESSKQADVGLTLAKNELSTEYDSYSFRAATKLTDALRVSAYGRYEELESDNNELSFFDADGDLVTTKDYESEEAREVTTVGANAVYRLGKGSSLRLGYEYEVVDRELDEIVLNTYDSVDGAGTREIGIDETVTQTVKAAVRFRPTNKVNSRISYTYQNIEDPFMHHFGNKGPISEDVWDGTDFPEDSKRWYGTAFYNLREAEATNQPEDVHELKASATWSPGANYSVTAYARVRQEENDLNYNTYEQTTFSPGVNVWWAPINDLNMTMAYNFNRMETENQMCVGWYHG